MQRKPIITVTLNPCYDRTVNIARFEYGGTNAVLSVQRDTSGKGINVSTVLNHLGYDTVCMGLMYSKGKEDFNKFFADEKLRSDFVEVPGSVRENIKIFDESAKTMTEFNDKGSVAAEETVRAVMKKIESAVASSSLVVLSGSVPPGFPKTIYAELIRKCGDAGVRVILDASKEFLLEGIREKPFLIKPNIDELQTIAAKKIESENEVIAEAKKLIDAGIAYVCVSLGKEGCILVSGNRAFKAPAMDIEEAGIQGAGDSLVAGLCAAITDGAAEEDYLRYATAAASASIMLPGTQLCLKKDFDELFPRAEVQRL